MKNKILITVASFGLALFFTNCKPATTENTPAAPAAQEEAPPHSAAATALVAPTVPDKLKVAVAPAFLAKATGVQIYECKPNDAGKLKWAFKGPDAQLVDGNDKPLGKHYLNTEPGFELPAWESLDGSKVLGKKIADDTLSPPKTAIPWLLLEVKKNAGNGIFSSITKIQRVETTGGKAPAGECSYSDKGKELRVPYTATYYFYAEK